MSNLTKVGLASLAFLIAITGLKANAQSLIDPVAYQANHADKKALAIGDLLTVLVLENVSAQSQASTRASGNSNAQIAGDDGHGLVDLSGGLQARGEAAGQTGRSGNFRAQLAATVIDREGNGVLRIKAHQTISINGESQEIVLSGRIRAVDIGASNTVLSHRIADAEISIVGEGVVEQAQRPGLFIRIMKWLRLV